MVEIPLFEMLLVRIIPNCQDYTASYACPNSYCNSSPLMVSLAKQIKRADMLCLTRVKCSSPNGVEYPSGILTKCTPGVVYNHKERERVKQEAS